MVRARRTWGPQAMVPSATSRPSRAAEQAMPDHDIIQGRRFHDLLRQDNRT
jgi:hypothetical protein